MKKFRHLPINWKDGVKLNSSHFIQAYNEAIARSREIAARFTTPFNFGLGEAANHEEEAISFVITGDSPSTMRIELLSCRGMTESGYIIDYTKDLYGNWVAQSEPLDCASYEDGSQFYVVVSVSPYELCPVGLPDPSISPLHHPYTVPRVRIDLVPCSEINTGIRNADYLIVGEMTYRNGLLLINERYIPPVQRLIYSPKAMEYYRTLTTILQRINGYTKLIYRKNIRDSRRTLLVDNTFKVCDAFMSFYNQHVFELTNIVPQQSPIALAQKVQILGQELLCSFMRMHEPEYEALLQYCYTWTDITPAELEAQLGVLASTHYDHLDIHRVLDQLLASVRTIEKVFAKLSELEYVGLMRENIIISEDVEEPTAPKKSAWRILG